MIDWSPQKKIPNFRPSYKQLQELFYPESPVYNLVWIRTPNSFLWAQINQLFRSPDEKRFWPGDIQPLPDKKSYPDYIS